MKACLPSSFGADADELLELVLLFDDFFTSFCFTIFTSRPGSRGSCNTAISASFGTELFPRDSTVTQPSLRFHVSPLGEIFFASAPRKTVVPAALRFTTSRLICADFF